MDNLIRSFAHVLNMYTKISKKCWCVTPEQCKEMMTMEFPLIQSFQMQYTLEKIGLMPFDSKKAAAELMEYEKNNTKSGEAEIVVDVDEGEPTIPLSAVEEVLRGECFDWHFKDLMGRIKQKAGL